jgi:hypothetical protein
VDPQITQIAQLMVADREIGQADHAGLGQADHE